MGGVEEFRRGERAESDHHEIDLRKRTEGKEQRRKWVEGRNKTVYFNFLELLFSVKVKGNQESESP
jgi:hypothetical protein